MKVRIFLLLLLATTISSFAQNITLTRFPGLQAEAYSYRDTSNTIHGRFPGTGPFFLVYPDTHCDSLQAAQLVTETGLDELMREYSGMVCVMNPLGETYDNEADLAAYNDFLAKVRVFYNLKVIGIGSGATFVNQAIATQAGAIAGIATIGGKAGKTVGASAVPAFISGKSSKAVAKTFISQNEAKQRRKDGGRTYYANSTDTLKQVVVSELSYPSLKDAMTDAWNELLCKNYRFNNYGHTWYNGCDPGEYGDYELEPYIMLEDLGITRNVVVNNLLGLGDFLWYEYFPEATLHAEEASTPLVILLHGNNNDPRTQAETSGFIELAAEENFIVAELEWQGNGYAPMGLDGIEQVVYELLKNYPQIDPSRVYAEGLSAGAATATGLGIRKSHVFAAVGAQSAGLFHFRYAFGYDRTALLNEAAQKRGHVEVGYFSVSGVDDMVVPWITPENWETNAFFSAWQGYQTLNGMEVSRTADFSIDPSFGIELEGRETIQTDKRSSMETGVLLKDGKPLIKVVAVNDYGHWNFKPASRMMWDFFTHFSRDPVTKKLIYTE